MSILRKNMYNLNRDVYKLKILPVVLPYITHTILSSESVGLSR